MNLSRAQLIGILSAAGIPAAALLNPDFLGALDPPVYRPTQPIKYPTP